jgi:hypothetical protein
MFENKVFIHENVDGVGEIAKEVNMNPTCNLSLDIFNYLLSTCSPHMQRSERRQALKVGCDTTNQKLLSK